MVKLQYELSTVLLKYMHFIPRMLQCLFTRVAQVRVSLHQMYDEVLS